MEILRKMNQPPLLTFNYGRDTLVPELEVQIGNSRLGPSGGFSVR